MAAHPLNRAELASSMMFDIGFYLMIISSNEFNSPKQTSKVLSCVSLIQRKKNVKLAVVVAAKGLRQMPRANAPRKSALFRYLSRNYSFKNKAYVKHIIVIT